MRTVIVTSAKDKMFCSGANIFMLGVSSHAWKVNFCKFTNETRNGLEDTSKHSGLKFLAAVNGACAGGGYELALACDEIVLVDDRNSAVSLPEVPLLGVLPGTGGLTRVTDKRHVRHDLADIFCTTRRRRARPEGGGLAAGGRGRQAQPVRRRACRSARRAGRGQRPPGRRQGRRPDAPAAQHRSRRAALLARHGRDRPRAPRRHLHGEGACGSQSKATSPPSRPQGAAWYPLVVARELEDAILSMRTNELDIGTWLVKTEGSAANVRSMDAALLANQGHWFVRETIGLLRRTFSRLDVSSRSLFALIEPGSCFAGSFLELALACDRSYHLAMPVRPAAAPKIEVGETNFGLYPMATGQSRLQRRFYEETPPLEAVRAKAGQPLDADAAFALGLVTSNPDDIDWPDETRLAIEERVAMSPDALTGMEANLRFNGPENMFTRIFGRLTAWQNWIFQRPNAVGDKGALKVYGKGERAQFDFNRV